MKISEIKFGDLYVGKKVISVMTGRTGTITRLEDVTKDYRYEDNLVHIKWENDNLSVVWHFQCQYVEELKEN